MAKQIYINLPVKDLGKSKAFFEALGFQFNSKFTNDQAACMIIDENILAMLLAEKHFRNFTKKDICDTSKSTEVLLCLSCNSRSEVDDLVSKATSAGGSIPREAEDHGFMYGHAFEDLDGHTWELLYMDANS